MVESLPAWFAGPVIIVLWAVVVYKYYIKKGTK